MHILSYFILGSIVLVVAVSVAIASGFILYGVSFLFSNKPKEEARRASLRIAVMTVLSVFPLTFFCLCQSLLSDPTNPSRGEPAQEDIVGVWSPTPASLERMREEGYRISTHVLTFRRDGTFEMINMPDWWRRNLGTSRKGFYSGSGTQEIDKVQDRWTIRAYFTSLSGYEDDMVTFFELSGRKPPYNIFYFLDDPDDYTDIMVFERQ